MQAEWCDREHGLYLSICCSKLSFICVNSLEVRRLSETLTSPCSGILKECCLFSIIISSKADGIITSQCNILHSTAGLSSWSNSHIDRQPSRQNENVFHPWGEILYKTSVSNAKTVHNTMFMLKIFRFGFCSVKLIHTHTHIYILVLSNN